MSKYTVVDFIGTGQVLYKDGIPILQRERFEIGELCEALAIGYEMSGENYYSNDEKLLEDIELL